MWIPRAGLFTIICILLTVCICFAEQSPATVPLYNGFFDDNIVHEINVTVQSAHKLT